MISSTTRTRFRRQESQKLSISCKFSANCGLRQPETERVAGQATGTDVGARLPAFGHLPFSGTYRTRIEANGRLALPSAFKHAFDDAAIVRSAGTQCLFLMTPRAFELVIDAMRESDPEMMLDARKRQAARTTEPGKHLSTAVTK